VLGRFSSREEPLVGPLVESVTDALELALRSGLEAAMGAFNRAGALGCEEAG
jgi:peptidyl-tRNA hydrolase